MNFSVKLTVVLLLAALTCPTTLAANKRQDTLDKITHAYGGERLTSMVSLIVNDRYKTIVKHGGTRPGLDSVSRLHSTLTVDFERDRKSVKNWNVRTRGKRLSEIMFDGNNGWSINYLRGSHVLRKDLNSLNVGSGMMRLLDTTLVRLLLEAQETVTYEGSTVFQSREHEKLRFKVNGTSETTIYVDSITGLISKMSRPNGTSYIYSEHRKVDGITYASDTNQFRNGKASMITLSRTINVNPDVSGAFTLPSSTKALEGMQDTSKMVVRKVGKNVFLAGQGNRSSLFVDAGDHFVGIGILPGFKSRIEAVYKTLNAEKPLKHVVLSEHQGHMGDIDAIATLGANFITVESHLPLIQQRLSKPLPLERFTLVNNTLNLANGRVRVYDIATINSDQFLLFYVPSEKLVFSMDEFGTNLLNSVPSADLRTISFQKAIEELGIDVEQFAYVHGTGILTAEQLQRVTGDYKEGICLNGHPICAD